MMNLKQTPRTSRTRRLVQFSLRGLLVLVAICSVWLGIAFHRAREQARAVAAIKSSGGYVFYDFQGIEADSFDQWGTSDVPAWLVNSLGVDFFHAVTLVVFDVTPITDDLLSTVSELPEVRYLAFLSAGLSDNSLVHLKRLKKLQMLQILSLDHEPPDFDDAALVVIADLSELRELEIYRESLTDSGLQQFNRLTKLQRLMLGDVQVSHAGAAELNKSLPECAIFVRHGDSVVYESVRQE